MKKSIAMRDALLTKIHGHMQSDEEIFFVTADFGSPVLDQIRQDFPDRFTNVGIAEQNLINISAGLALEGFKVFAYAIAPFITMRCFEQLRVNLALLSEVRSMNVNLIGVGAGYSYVVSGPTHQCYEDISLIRSLPNFQIFSPSDEHTSASLITNCLDVFGPKYIRLDAQVLPELRSAYNEPSKQNGFECLREGEDGVIISTGYMTHTALKVAEALSPNIELTVIDLIDITGFKKTELNHAIANKNIVVSLEEGFEGRGGIDSLLTSHFKSKKMPFFYHGIGVKPGYSFELGNRQQLHELVGIGVEAVTKRVSDIFIKIGK